MGKVTYTCRFDSELLFSSHPSASLSGPSSTIPDTARITNAEFEVYCGVSTYNYDADCCATLTDKSGNTFEIDSTCDTGESNRIWASWDENVSESESASIDWNNLDTVELSGTNKLTVRTGYDATLTIEYEEYSRCSAPTSVSIEHERTAAATNVLSWSGASAGDNNPITGYFVQYTDSPDGATWNGWHEGGSISTSATSGSMTVSMPAENTYRKWRVWTLGTASGYDSESSADSMAAYRGHAALEGFTDDPLTAGIYVKALHMTELQNNVNTLRTFYGLSAYAFSPIDARGIAGWTEHVNELREAIDAAATAAGKSHEAWIAFSVNCPRADVMNQLRAVVLAL